MGICFWNVELRETVKIHRAHVEVAAVAAAGEVDLRHAFGGEPGVERIEIADQLVELVVEQELGVGHQQPGPAPHPLVAQRELPRGLGRAAEGVRGRAARTVACGEIAGIELVDAGDGDRIRAGLQTLAPVGL